MKGIRVWLVPLAFAGFVVAAAPAGAQGKLDKDSMERWGGAWAVDCKDAKSKRLTMYDDRLVYEGSGKTATGTKVQGAASWFGNSPPDNYVMTFLGESPGEKQIVAIIYTDDKGEFMVVDGDEPAVRLTPAQSANPPKYRRCADAAKKADTAAAPPPDGKPAPAGETAAAPTAPATMPAGDMLPSPPEMLASDPAFKSAYTKALGKYAKEPWLTELTGPSSPTTKVTVEGVEYTAINACKEHDCADNTMVAFYSAAKKKVYGKVVVAGKSALIGNPPPAVSKEIGAMWFKQFKANQ